MADDTWRGKDGGLMRSYLFHKSLSLYKTPKKKNKLKCDNLEKSMRLSLTLDERGTGISSLRKSEKIALNYYNTYQPFSQFNKNTKSFFMTFIPRNKTNFF